MLYRVVLAERYKDCVLFFPHNMDFRGRVYPISPYLSHMGDDVSRSLLKFAKGKLFCEEYHYERISLSSRMSIKFDDTLNKNGTELSKVFR